MKRVLIFGGGRYGQALVDILYKKKDVKILYFIDNNISGQIKDVPVIKPQEINNVEYDYIILAVDAVKEVMEQLISLGVDEFKINTSFLMDKGIGARELFLKHFAGELYRKNVQGMVAEAGVFKGAFASVINEVFHDKKLYLFDTFEGFDEKDLKLEQIKTDNFLNNQGYFNETSVQTVMSKMIYPENVIIKKGFVPDTFEGIDEKFCFVNLDLDLYKPTLESLKWFWPRVVGGGGILIHDYFNDYTFPNLKKAVIEFADIQNINYFPIGDGLSVFIQKIK